MQPLQMIAEARRTETVWLGFLSLRPVLRHVEQLSGAEGAVGNRFKRVCADRTTRPPTVDASQILDRAKYGRSTLAGLSVHMSSYGVRVVGGMNCKRCAPRIRAGRSDFQAVAAQRIGRRM